MGTHTPKLGDATINWQILDELKRKAALWDEQQAKIDELVKALEFYANGGHYTEFHDVTFNTNPSGDWVKTNIVNDRGEKAQAALTRAKGE